MTYYDNISEGYEKLHKEEQLKKIAIIKQNIQIKQDDKLLDVGCGTGITTEPWSCRRFGIDPAHKLLEKARQKQSDKKEKIEYKQASAESIPYPDNFFDIVISITAIQNFNDIEKGLKEIKRVGKDKFILTFLKRSQKKELIEKKIEDMFSVKKKIEEEKDIIFII